VARNLGYLKNRRRRIPAERRRRGSEVTSKEDLQFSFRRKESKEGKALQLKQHMVYPLIVRVHLKSNGLKVESMARKEDLKDSLPRSGIQWKVEQERKIKSTSE